MLNRLLVQCIASAVLMGAFALIMPASFASNLNEQLSIRSHNGTQGSMRSSADRWVEQGHREAQSGRAEAAIAAWKQALNLYQQIGDVPAQGRVYDLLGMTFVNLDLMDEAEEAFRRSLAIAHDEKNVVRQIYGFNNVGTVLLRRAQITEAQRSFSEGLELARNIRHAAGQGLSLSNLGLGAYRAGRYQEAIQYLEQARDFRNQNVDPLGAANTLSTLGDAYLAIRDYRSTFASHRQAMFLGQQKRDRPTQYRAMDGMMAAYQGLGQETRFTEIMNQRFTFATEHNDAWEVLISLKMMAQYQRRKGDLTQAENYYLQAYSVAREINATREAEYLKTQIGMLQSRKYQR
jgi:tetratricopeptide (TPR) repeat protein